MVIGLLFASSIIDITSRNEVIKELILDASDISSVLMTEGYGTNWMGFEGIIGLTTNKKFDMTKFITFLNLEYTTQQAMLGTHNDLWIYLKDREGDIVEDNGLGRVITSLDDISADNLVHIKRFVFYNQDIHTLGVVVW